MKRDRLIKFLNDYFGEELFGKAEKVDPTNANGVQLEGAEAVTGVVLGVSSTMELYKQAKNKKCNFIITHHGLRFHKLGLYINKIYKKRLQFLLNSNFTLCAYHFVLDHHPEIGNNAQIIKKLGAVRKENFFEEWGWIGEFDRKVTSDKLKVKSDKLFGRKPLAEFLYGKKKIKKIAVVSGGASLKSYQDETNQILKNNIDLYITGEAHESTEATCKEAEINYLAYGHYQTETFGIKALGEVLKKEFPKLPVKFIEIPNKF